jgi:hypothetical protein
MTAMPDRDAAPYPRCIGAMRSFCATGPVGPHTFGTMTKLDASHPTRTLTIELPEADWAALRSVEPDAVGWLQGRIRERLRGSADAGPDRRFDSSSRSPSESYWGADEY